MLSGRVITMTTDFGCEDPFAGVMKGVILKINPQATIIDLTHGIQAHDIRGAAFCLGMNYGFFPDRSVHIAVVDPSVGSDRRPILVAADRHYFIGPDNGIFSYIYSAAREFLQVIHITDDHYFLKPKSPTFQGRDIFAPVAAWVAGGKDILNFGSVISDYVNMPLPVPEVSGAKIRGEIIAIDRFGNAMSNIRESDLERLVADKPERLTKVLLHGVDVPMKEFYAEASDKALCAVMNSSGYLEFFVNRGSASSAFSISIGDRVEITLSA